jgi:thiamine biosynthesis lipoprotein
MVIFVVRKGNEPKRLTEHKLLMGTIVKITAFDPDEEILRGAIDKAFVAIAHLDSVATRSGPNSAVTRINSRSPSEEQVYIDLDVSTIISRSQAISRMTGGAFDVTVAPLVDLWTFDEGADLPSDVEIREALSRVGYEQIGLHPTSGALTLATDVHIDLNGIAKGRAVDRAYRMLRTAGVDAAVIDAGGDLRMLGLPPESESWRIGLKHPRQDGLLGVLSLRDGSVATSGDYQRFMVKDGVRYHHILDPSTGFPAVGIMSVTIVTKRCEDADALATAVFVMGARRGMRFVERTDGVEAVIVTGSEEIEEILISSGLEGRFERSE